MVSGRCYVEGIATIASIAQVWNLNPNILCSWDFPSSRGVSRCFLPRPLKTSFFHWLKVKSLFVWQDARESCPAMIFMGSILSFHSFLFTRYQRLVQGHPEKLDSVSISGMVITAYRGIDSNTPLIRSLRDGWPYCIRPVTGPWHTHREIHRTRSFLKPRLPSPKFPAKTWALEDYLPLNSGYFANSYI